MRITDYFCSQLWWNGLNRRISTLSSAQRTEWITNLRVAIAETTPNPDFFVCTHLFPIYQLNKIQPLMSQQGVAHSLQIPLLQHTFDFAALVSLLRVNTDRKSVV